MKPLLFPALIITLLCLGFFCIVYPVAIWGVAQLATNHGRGEIIEQNGHVVGFTNVGQQFTEDRYFNSRPSAVEYNAASSGGSNKGPSNPDYLLQVQARIDTFLVHNPTVKKSEIPSELVTASGSGLDPHLSRQAALVQVPRIAKIRNLPEQRVQGLVLEHTQKPLLGLFGTETVNVLQLNLALDHLQK